ncbi:5-formyltetrahydrofolate cyclo-ligase [Desulfuromonas versatilis]|uniref:5-formyltetrahydrofolate cyclo-ligase n=1 Tax=Desulfuromonas versatilis TaxID=2802975 RepID=A0ABN6DVS6_9BACT|nr:5-formyltetrahydrofolate cyclo-ligase [Desulfuromonas versatilis]BCR04170.1 5-formyltetrahydrofolate cyclo-ligase [Desulfuromonas versatilis]
MPKKSIRGRMLAQRRHLAAETCFAQSLHIQQNLLDTPEFAAARSVALYSPVYNEVFTEELFHAACRAGKRVAYPRVRGEVLEFLEVPAIGDLRPGAFGILEPVGSAALEVAQLDLLVVPGVAFDEGGYRLGYGKGFYDRVLHGCQNRGILVGLCFKFQLVSSLPVETHDIGMDMLVTEEQVLRFGANARPRTRGYQ